MQRRAVLGLLTASVAVPALSGCDGHHAGRKKSTPADGAGDPSVTESAFAAGVPTAEDRGGGPHVVMLIRHGEKPTGSAAPYGVSEAGERDDEALTTQGWARAGALTGLFAPLSGPGRPGPVRPGLARPAEVIAADPGRHGSQRPQQTVAAVAAALGTEVGLPFAKGQEAELAAALRAGSGPRLVAWEHESIPAIISHLGPVTPEPPTAWPSDRFDLVWVFARDGDGWRFSQVPQLLLAGDSPDSVG
jgi:hypothetical protein